MLNINLGHNQELLGSCKTLRDYSAYTAKVRAYAKTMLLQDAVERAVEECIREDILVEFLTKNKAEAIKVSIYEFDEEKYTRLVRQEGEEIGEERGKEIGQKMMLALIEELIKDNCFEDIEKIKNDAGYLENLYREYQII